MSSAIRALDKAWRARADGDVKVKIVLLAVAASATEPEVAVITNTTLSRLTGLSLKDVEDSRTILENAGYFSTMHRGPGSYEDAVFVVQLHLGEWA